MNITTLEEFTSSLPSLEEMDAYYDRFLQPAFSSYDYISYGKLFPLPEPHVEAKIFLGPINTETKAYSISKVEFYFNGILFRELLKFEGCIIWVEYFKGYWEFKVIAPLSGNQGGYYLACNLSKNKSHGLITWCGPADGGEKTISVMHTRACMEVQRLYGDREIK